MACLLENIKQFTEINLNAILDNKVELPYRTKSRIYNLEEYAQFAGIMSILHEDEFYLVDKFHSIEKLKIKIRLLMLHIFSFLLFHVSIEKAQDQGRADLGFSQETRKKSLQIVVGKPIFINFRLFFFFLVSRFLRTIHFFSFLVIIKKLSG